ncbi:MAG TPA: universal stress protein [Gammaproteobacteria bacterium]|nr:universal stress protein [Gammaproteobacteria bacterium]
MSYKSLLACIDRDTQHAHVMETALDLAGRFSAWITGLHVYVPTAFAEGAGMALPVWGGGDAMEREQKQAREQAAELRAELEAAAARHGVTQVEWQFHWGELASTVARHARYADLVVMGQHDPGESGSRVSFDSPAEVAILSGRPVLVLPYAGRIREPGRRVLLAWDGSNEAARAVTGALPLLAAADFVQIVVVDGDRSSPATGEEEPGAGIARYLQRHGVDAGVSTVYRGGLSVAETLLSAVADKGADLLCMGAYGHSRLRELMLGGVTREMMRHMTVPTLIAC